MPQINPSSDPRSELEIRQRYQQMYLDGVVEYVSLVAADANACPTCLAITDRGYLPLKLPNLPVEGCTRSSGCRCRYEPLITVVE
jgi:hypothetical protein